MVEKKHERRISTCILLYLFLPFYDWYWKYVLIKNTKLLKNDNSSCKGELLCCIFVPFSNLYWWITRGRLVEKEFSKYGLSTSGNGILYLFLALIGLEIIPMAIMQNDFNDLPSQQTIYHLSIPQNLMAWICLSPAILLLLVFTVWPIFNTLRMAFLNNYGNMAAMGGATFQFGIDNFLKVIEYKKFLDCLKTTAILCVATVPISTTLALLIAVALNSIKPLQKTLQTIFFLPYVTNSIAIGMVFATMFNIVGYNPAEGIADTWGIINNVIEFFGGQPVSWINQGSTYAANIAVMIVYIVWNALPFKILILLGGLQSINKQYYDAAKVDGTPKARVLTRITIPLLSPMLAYVIITGFIGGFKEYSSIIGIFGEKMGPPDDAGRLNTMVGFVYDALEKDRQGLASAGALILFVIILLVTIFNNRVIKKHVHY